MSQLADDTRKLTREVEGLVADIERRIRRLQDPQQKGPDAEKEG